MNAAVTRGSLAAHACPHGVGGPVAEIVCFK
jgi:hypothetical protein